MCTSSLGQTLRPGQTYIYNIYQRPPNPTRGDQKMPRVRRGSRPWAKMCIYIYIYIYSNRWMHVTIYIYNYEYVNILKSLCVREEVPVCCDAVLWCVRSRCLGSLPEPWCPSLLLGLAGSIPLSGLAGRTVRSDLAAWTRGFDPAVWARCPVHSPSSLLGLARSMLCSAAERNPSRQPFNKQKPADLYQRPMLYEHIYIGICECPEVRTYQEYTKKSTYHILIQKVFCIYLL